MKMQARSEATATDTSELPNLDFREELGRIGADFRSECGVGCESTFLASEAARGGLFYLNLGIFVKACLSSYGLLPDCDSVRGTDTYQYTRK